MTLPCIDSLHCYASDFGYGSPGSVNFLLNVVAGVGGGRLLGIPWHVLPLIRAFVKERLALSAFSFCQCSYPSASWGSDSHVGTALSREDRLGWVLGCICSGWKKGALGTLSCTDRLGVSVLQQEIANLRSVTRISWGENRDCIVYPLHVQFSRIAISADSGGMAHPGDNVGLLDIKKNLRRLYKMTTIGVMDNKEMAKEIKSMSETVSCTSLQVSNNDARIDDTESNLCELMGKVDRIQEDLEKLITMNQGSRVNVVNEADDHPMEEESVMQPRALRGNP